MGYCAEPRSLIGILRERGDWENALTLVEGFFSSRSSSGRRECDRGTVNHGFSLPLSVMTSPASRSQLSRAPGGESAISAVGSFTAAAVYGQR